MTESIFRKKNLDKIKEPDNLDQYIQVANPGGWVLLGAILCLLIGTLFWATFGTIETKVQTLAIIENKTATLEVQDNQISTIESGMPVRINDAEGTVWKVNPKNNTVIIKINIPDGAYDAEIVTETIQPISLIFE